MKPISAMNSLSGLDAAFLYMETPTSPMNVVGTLVLDPSTARAGWSYERILRLVGERVPRIPPLRRRLMSIPFELDHPVWVEDPDFSLGDHVYRVNLPAPGSDRILADFVAEVGARRLDRSRPLWEIWFVEGLSGGRVALVVKLHHATTDGMSGGELILQLLDLSPDPVAEEAPADAWKPDAVPSQTALLRRAAIGLTRRPAGFARLLADTGRSAAGLARASLSPEGFPSAPALPLTAPRTRFNGAISSRRTVAYGETQLADLKFIKRAFGTTVNDVVLAACSLSLRSYLQAHGDLPDAPLVAAVPISVRTPEQRGTYGNQVSSLFVHLPVQLEDPLDQLLAIAGETRQAKRLHAAVGGNMLGDWVQFASPAVFSRAAQLYSRWKLANRHRPLHNLVISNCPGPPVPLYAAGARVTAIYPHGPVLEGAGVNISVVSYVDRVDFGVIACRESVPDVWDLALGFGAAVGDLVKIALEEAPEVPVPEPMSA